MTVQTATPDTYATAAALQEAQAETEYLRARNRALAQLAIALRVRLAELEQETPQ